MADNYPEPPRTDWGGLALLSDAADPYDYEDIHGDVIDEENWKALQRKILEEGTYADRPDTAPFDGAKYHATDINVVFTWNDSAGEWEPLNTGTSDNPVPGTSHYEAINTDELYTGSVEMFVSPDGSDSNDGVSENDPKQTIQAAIDDAPIQANRLTINVADGTYTSAASSILDVSDSLVDKIEIVGGTDTNGDPTVTLDGENDTYVVNVSGNVEVDLIDLELLASDQPLNATNNAVVRCENCRLNGSADTLRAFYIQMGATFNLDESSVVDVAAATDLNWAGAVTAASAHIGGTIVGGPLYVKENAWAFIQDTADLDAGGDVDCVRIWMWSHCKVGSATFRNAERAIRYRNVGGLSLAGSPTFDNIDTAYSGTRTSFFDDRDGDKHIGFPGNNDTPDISDQSSQSGIAHYNATKGRLEYYSEGHNSWMDVGREKLKSGETIVPGEGSASTAEIATNGNKGSLDWDISSTTGNDVSLSISHDVNSSGNREIVFSNSGADDATVVWTYWESEL